MKRLLKQTLQQLWGFPQRRFITTNRRLIASIATISSLVLLSPSTFAQLPTPTYGINIGNTLEPSCGEGCWGPVLQESVIHQYAASGFNAVRIPVAWDAHANQSTLVIDPAWIARVKQVVDWCFARNLTVIINSHDNAWLNSRLDGNVDADVNNKMGSYWRQIAQAFTNYDSRLLFSAVNEESADTPAKYSEMLAYYQTFVNTVRYSAGGSNNTNRWLILPGPKTDIDATNDLMNSLPWDPTPGRLCVEVHYYTPYQFCLMNGDADWGKMFYFWGADYKTTVPSLLQRNATHSEEAYMLAQFQKMQTKFTSKGIPVVLGEYMGFDRTGASDLPAGDETTRQRASVTFFNKKVSDYCNQTGLKPFVWDTGFLINRNTGAVQNQYQIPSLTGGAAQSPPGSGGVTVGNGTYKIIARHSSKALDAAGTADGTQILQWTYNGGNNQRWMLTDRGSSQYSIIGVQSGKGLDINGWSTANGAKVQLWTYGGGANQKFTFAATSGGYYRITPAHATGSCLDVNGNSSADGALVQLWGYGGGNNQQWALQTP